MYHSAKFKAFGDRAVIVELGDVISPEVNRRVHHLHDAVYKAELPGVDECVPTFRSLMITYDPIRISYEDLVFMVKDLENSLNTQEVGRSERRATIPVVYGGDLGPDLASVSEFHHLREIDVIRFHSGREYIVYMIGFIAGFPYLGELANEIATPRLESPRLHVPEGSVGIAEKQTGIYPREAPGGWRIIGKTPIKLFDPSWQPPALLKPGDRVRFKSVSMTEFLDLRTASLRGTFDPFQEE